MVDLSLLRDVEIFNGLPDRFLRKVVTVFKEQPFHKGERLFAQDDKAEQLMIVKQGFVGISMRRTEGEKESTFLYIGRGQSIGEMPWVDRGNRSGSAYVASDEAVLALAAFSDLDALCNRHPKIGYRVMRNIAADISFRLRQQALKNILLQRPQDPKHEA